MFPFQVIRIILAQFIIMQLDAEKEEAFSILRFLSYYSALPEPLRLAHVIAAGFSQKSNKKTI